VLFRRESDVNAFPLYNTLTVIYVITKLNFQQLFFLICLFDTQVTYRIVLIKIFVEFFFFINRKIKQHLQ